MNIGIERFGDVTHKILTTHLRINDDVLGQLSLLAEGKLSDNGEKIKGTILQDPVAIVNFYSFFAEGYQDFDLLLQKLTNVGLKKFIKEQTDILRGLQDTNEEVEKEFNKVRFIGQKRGIVYQILSSASKCNNNSIQYQIRAAVSIIDQLLALSIFGKDWINWKSVFGESEVFAIIEREDCDLKRLADRYLRNRNLFPVFNSLADDSFSELMVNMSSDIVECYDKGEWENKVLKRAKNPLEIRLFKGYMLQDINSYDRLIRRLTNYLGLAARSEASYAAIRQERRDRIEERKESRSSETKIVVDAKEVMDHFAVDLSRPKVQTRILEASGRSLTKDSDVIAIKSAHNKLVKLTKRLSEANSQEELLLNLLGSLVESSDFKCAALIVVSKTKENAMVVASRGEKLRVGQKIELTDPLNPLKLCITKIQSFAEGAEISLFGSKSYALSPIEVNHQTPVALYADCGDDDSISFESRRIFRNIVEIINQKLPNLAGGMPSEF